MMKIIKTKKERLQTH